MYFKIKATNPKDELNKENLSEANFKKQYLLEPECDKPRKKDKFGYIKRKQR